MDNESVTSDFTDKFPSTLSMLAQVKKNAMVDENEVQLGDDFDNDKDTDNSENGQDTSGDDQKYNKGDRDSGDKSIKKAKSPRKLAVMQLKGCPGLSYMSMTTLMIKLGTRIKE